MVNFAVVSGWILTRDRKLLDVFPKSLRHLWNDWELRTSVLVSLSIQIILILLGNRRKYNATNCIRLILWLAYLLADWIATVSLGILANNYENDVLKAFWAPFLLLHLGGPDTITAYSLEDNELWLRHLLELVFQSGVVFYVVLKSWTSSWFNFLTVPVFVAGLIKYGERIWVLRSASIDHFGESMRPPPDPGPNYAKFMDDYASRKAEGFKPSLGTVIEDPTDTHQFATVASNSLVQDAVILQHAYSFYGTFRRLFADLILSFQDRDGSQKIFQKLSCDHAFRVIEVELGFVYDILHTKALVCYSYLGGILRSLSFSCTTSAFIAFLAIDKKNYSNIDVSITCILLVGAIVLEIYSILVLVSSNWTMLWLIKLEKRRIAYAYKIICHVQQYFFLPTNKGWSGCISQYNLISICLGEKPAKCRQIERLFGMSQMLDETRNKHIEIVSSDLKVLIFEQLLEKSRAACDIYLCKQICTQRGHQVLERANCLEKLSWSIEVEFDQSILLWHIATDLCYYTDQTKDSNIIESSKCKAGKLLSDYMMYLLVLCPGMLPNGIGQIRFQDTCAEAIEFFRERKKLITDRSKASEKLLQVNTDILPLEVKGDKSKSLLFDACRLAKFLQSLETGDEKWESEKKWELISHVWIEMLSYAASQCRSVCHARQLRQGGELLTHVWLLMAHLGISEHFQISQGHARVTLLVN